MSNIYIFNKKKEAIETRLVCKIVHEMIDLRKFQAQDGISLDLIRVKHDLLTDRTILQAEVASAIDIESCAIRIYASVRCTLNPGIVQDGGGT